MTQNSTFNIKSSDSQLNKVKSGIKNGAGIKYGVVGDSDGENNFPHKLS